MNKKYEKILYSFIGILLIIFISVLINFISSKIYKRIDLTENKIYTLSDASKKILNKLDTPVKIKFYFSKSNSQMPVYLKTYAKRVEDLLEEYVQAGKGNITLEKLDPEPDSDAEDAAIMDGVDGQMLQVGEKIYFGISISCIDKTRAIPFLTPEKENLLEYDLTKGIAEVYNSDKTTIGIMSPLPVMGSQMSPQMMGQMNNMNQTWLSIKNLKQAYDVKSVPMNTSKIDNDIKVLIIIHPAGISDQAQYAIDQFIMKGGKVIAYLDPVSYYAMAQQTEKSHTEKFSNLPKLLAAWGIQFDTSKVVVDAEFGHKVPRQQDFLSVLDLGKECFNQKDVVTSELERITMVFAGSFTGKPVEGLKKDILISSSSKSGTIAASFANQPTYIYKNFVPEDKKFDLGIKLTGKFKTAFPDGIPGSSSKNSKDKTESLKECKQETAVVLIGDSDLLIDNICVAVKNILGKRFMIPINDNLNLSQNFVDLFGGDTDLITIRCRPVVSRPFTLVKKLEAQAEEEFKAKIQEAEKELLKTQNRLNSLQKQKKNRNQRFILSPEQKEELSKFKDKQVKVRKELKHLRKALRKNIDNLEENLKWFNIAFIPILIVILGIIVAIIRKRKGGAK